MHSIVRLVSRKLQKLIALYKAKGLGGVLTTFLVKVLSYPIGSRRVQDLILNLRVYRIHQELARKGDKFKSTYSIKVSILMHVDNISLDWLMDSIISIKNQAYKNFEVLIAFNLDCIDHQSRSYLESMITNDPRFRLYKVPKYLGKNEYYNILIDASCGDFLTLINPGDRLSPEALYEVMSLIEKCPTTDFLYSDDAEINNRGWLVNPFFKPDWNPDTFLSRMYTGRLSVFRKNLVCEIGGFYPEFQESQEYEMILRLTEVTQNIQHISKVLYWWRINENDYTNSRNKLKRRFHVTENAAKGIQKALIRRKEPGQVIIDEFAGFKIRYNIQEYSKVSIIIPTRDLWKSLDNCLDSIFSKSTYPNYEVIVVDNGSQNNETFKVFEKWKQRELDRFQVYRLDIPFNYSKLNNFAVKNSHGKYLLFLNNDTEIINSDWIEAMVEQSQRTSIGAVGVLLLYPDDTIQHGGVVLGLGGAAGHVFCDLPYGDIGYFDQPNVINNYTALTAACLMCRRDVFQEVKGFEEALAVAYNDTDFCLKIHSKGYRNIYLPHVKLYHYESKSRGVENTPDQKRRFATEISYLQNTWRSYILHDPSYNQNLTTEKSDYSLNMKRYLRMD
jgi:GT2 family glycosyltransferase